MSRTRIILILASITVIAVLTLLAAIQNRAFERSCKNNPDAYHTRYCAPTTPETP